MNADDMFDEPFRQPAPPRPNPVRHPDTAPASPYPLHDFWDHHMPSQPPPGSS